MGCGVSRVDFHQKRESDQVREGGFRLSTTKFHFSQRQLARLNRKFNDLLECTSGKERKKQSTYLSVIVERLIQRLVCSVGNLDPRFSSKFLVNLEPLKSYNYEPKKNLKYKYLVRLDLLSSPAIYPELFEAPVKIVEGTKEGTLPQGYARLRVHGEYLEEWMGFIGANGYLRRDKIQERFIELLARAAAKPTEPFTPKDVDESRLCGSPGKVVDPVTLHHILRTPSFCRFFFGAAECNESRFPDPRDFRIAIVEGVPEIRLHISFLSPTAQSITTDDDVEVSIVLGIGVTGWPSETDFPFRLTLDHPDIILEYHAAQLGYYLVPRGPHASVYCDDRFTAWEIRIQATEMFLQHHYSATSVVFRIQKILFYLLEVLRARGVKTINRYILKNLLLFELEKKSSVRQWAPKMMSTRVLSIFDQLLASLRSQNVPSFVFPEKNILLQENVTEEDYISDGDILDTYLKLLYSDGCLCEQEKNEFVPTKDLMENVMLQKWENVVGNMLPPMSNRSTRLSIAINNSPTSVSYTRQQVEYVTLLMRQVLQLKNIQRGNEGKRTGSSSSEGQKPERDLQNREDFIYLLQVVFEQAKEKLVSSVASHSAASRRRKTLKLNQILLSYDISTAMLLDDMRRNEEMNFRFENDIDIVVRVLECLHKAVDSDGRILGPVLRSYLNQLFRGSHENCWFLQEWKKRSEMAEIRAMEAFGNLVLSGRIDPLDGIVNAAGKGWTWANTCLRIVQNFAEENSKRLLVGEKIDSGDSGVRLIFTPEPQKTVRFNVTLAKDNGHCNSRRLQEEGGDQATGSDTRFATIKSFQEVLDTAILSDKVEKVNLPRRTGTLVLNDKPPHTLLRDGNPFTVSSMETRRQGNHRGLGSIVQALISLQKLTVLQEISQYLPDRDRTRVLNDIKKLSKEVQRLSIENHKKSCSALSPSENRNPKTRFSFRKSSTESLYSKKSTFGWRGSKTKGKQQQQAATSKPREIYKSIDEFTRTREKSLRKKESKRNEKPREEEKSADETLLGTCRVLRQHRPTVLDSNSLRAFHKPARFIKGSSTFSNSVINTPFYIKISSFDSKADGETTEF